ncbi:hypothetical protein [Muriicola marianensis]|uniref:Uncharacterized protein n=1 Tax=Muriicola marianensis TaxID=1324801 RepID=A0ABQ1QSJ3_9FLAO|nr:hypothetical protein [Muriicola marianensis]GGD42693.1 hypothetical protein GCM10011361_07090 [Muriicola marianensis]
MKNKVILLLSLFLWACNDGDLEIASIDFDDISLQTCETTVTTGTTVFFKIDGDESLILDLQDGILANEESQDTIISTIPGQSTLVYRIFSGTVTKNYFCDAIPPAEPTVEEEIEAVSGEVLVSTVRNALDTLQFDHTIQLRNITLINAQGERITDTSIDDFGTVSTKQ